MRARDPDGGGSAPGTGFILREGACRAQQGESGRACSYAACPLPSSQSPDQQRRRTATSAPPSCSGFSRSRSGRKAPLRSPRKGWSLKFQVTTASRSARKASRVSGDARRLGPVPARPCPGLARAPPSCRARGAVGVGWGVGRGRARCRAGDPGSRGRSPSGLSWGSSWPTVVRVTLLQSRLAGRTGPAPLRAPRAAPQPSLPGRAQPAPAPAQESLPVQVSAPRPPAPVEVAVFSRRQTFVHLHAFPSTALGFRALLIFVAQAWGCSLLAVEGLVAVLGAGSTRRG